MRVTVDVHRVLLLKKALQYSAEDSKKSLSGMTQASSDGNKQNRSEVRRVQPPTKLLVKIFFVFFNG